MSERRTDDATLIAALRILARDIQSGDSCANACLLEAAARLAALVEERRSITTLLGKVESLEADNAKLRKERDALLESEAWGVNCKPTEQPEVAAVRDILPDVADDKHDRGYTEGWNCAGQQWRTAIGKAGVSVKEANG